MQLGSSTFCNGFTHGKRKLKTNLSFVKIVYKGSYTPIKRSTSSFVRFCLKSKSANKTFTSDLRPLMNPHTKEWKNNVDSNINLKYIRNFYYTCHPSLADLNKNADGKEDKWSMKSPRKTLKDYNENIYKSINKNPKAPSVSDMLLHQLLAKDYGDNAGYPNTDLDFQLYPDRGSVIAVSGSKTNASINTTGQITNPYGLSYGGGQVVRLSGL